MEDEVRDESERRVQRNRAHHVHVRTRMTLTSTERWTHAYGVVAVVFFLLYFWDNGDDEHTRVSKA